MNEKLKDELAARYASEEDQVIDSKRKERVEHPFGHIKRNLGCGAFLMGRLEAAKAEFSPYASCFNFSTM